jgi:hypothetical protein
MARPAGLVSVHACGGIFGSIRSVGPRCGCGGHRARSAKVELQGAKPDQIVVILKAREPARIMTAIGDKKLNR